MSCDLGFASAERDEHGECRELAGRYVNPGPGVVVAEAVGRKELLNVGLLGRCRCTHARMPACPHARNPVSTDDAFLDGKPGLGPGIR